MALPPHHPPMFFERAPRAHRSRARKREMERNPVPSPSDPSPKHPHHAAADRRLHGRPAHDPDLPPGVVVGVLTASVAKALLALITFFTNLFYFQRFSLALVTPAGHHLGVLSVWCRCSAACSSAILARYGSEKIRGHGIPEALEAILIRGSRIAAAGGAAEAALLGDLHRIWRTVRRGGADHHDRRRVRLDDRAALSPDRGRAQDAAGRRRRGRHVGHLRLAGGGGAARRRAPAVRAQAAQPDAGRARQRRGRRWCAATSSGQGRCSPSPTSTSRRRPRR